MRYAGIDKSSHRIFPYCFLIAEYSVKKIGGSDRWRIESSKSNLGSLLASAVLFAAVLKENVLRRMAVPDEVLLSNLTALWAEERPKRDIVTDM